MMAAMPPEAVAGMDMSMLAQIPPEAQPRLIGLMFHLTMDAGIAVFKML